MSSLVTACALTLVAMLFGFWLGYGIGKRTAFSLLRRHMRETGASALSALGYEEQVARGDVPRYRIGGKE